MAAGTPSLWSLELDHSGSPVTTLSARFSLSANGCSKLPTLLKGSVGQISTYEGTPSVRGGPLVISRSLCGSVLGRALAFCLL